MSLKELINEDMKTAMRAKDKQRLGTVRLILADIKRKEVDTRIDVTDSDVLVILNKMVKQRQDSIQQFQKAERQDLVDQEQAELVIIQSYLPQALTDSELSALLEQAMQETGAVTAQDMGKVMNWLKPQVQGRTDMGKLSGVIKARLNTGA